MNKGRLVLGLGLIVLSAAIFFISTSANRNISFLDDDGADQNRISITKNVTDIHSILADGAVSVKISTSDTESVRYVYNDKKYQNKSTFENGVLNIDFSSKKSGFTLFGNSGSSMQVFVAVKNLQHIEMNGVGSVKSTNNILADKIKIINDGTGSMELTLTANKIKARNSGVGSLKISGKTDTAKLSNDGVGSLDAFKLRAQVLTATNDGVGSMEVYAEKEISLRNSGVGSVQYGGNAKVIRKQSKGVGSISKR